MIDLSAALRAVIGSLDTMQIDYIVVGSTAAAAWGVARTTRDVDLVVMLGSSEVDKLAADLSDAGLYVPFEQAREAARSGGSFDVLDPETGGKVDVFVSPADDAFTRSRLQRKIRAEVLGVAAWVDSAENVVLAKLLWRLESRSDVQWRDCAEVAASNDLDLDYMWEWAEVLGVASDLTGLLRSIGRV